MAVELRHAARASRRLPRQAFLVIVDLQERVVHGAPPVLDAREGVDVVRRAALGLCRGSGEAHLPQPGVLEERERRARGDDPVVRRQGGQTDGAERAESWRVVRARVE